eukprot:403350001
MGNIDKRDNKTTRLIINEAQYDSPAMVNVYFSVFINIQYIVPTPIIFFKNAFLTLKLSEMGFDIAFGGYFDIQDSFGSITATHVTKVRVKNESSGIIDEQFSFKDLDLIKCGYENFNYERKNESAYQDVVSLMCIENKDDLVLGGAWTTNRFERIDVCLSPCQNSTGNSNSCQPQSQIEDFFKTVDFQLRFVNQYFDFEDMNAPIKKFIEDRYFVPVQTWEQKGMNIFVKKGYTKLQDSYMPFIPQNDIQYASVINVKPYTSQVDYFGNCYVKFSFRIDFESELLTRQVYSFTDLLSDFGGIYSALFAIGAIVVGVFRENLFYKEIIKNLYQARPPRQKKIKMKKKFQLTDYSASVLNESHILQKSINQDLLNQTAEKSKSSKRLRQLFSSSRTNHEKPKDTINSKRPLNQDHLQANIFEDKDFEDLDLTINKGQNDINFTKLKPKIHGREKSFNISFLPNQSQDIQDYEKQGFSNSQLFKTKLKPINTTKQEIGVDDKTQEDIFQVQSQKSLVQRIIDEVLNRVSFKFSLADLIKTTLYKLRPGDLGLVKHLDSHRNIYLFKKGVKKINNEFDALSILKLMKQVKLLTTTLLNPSQRLMLGFQKKNVLDSDTSNQNSEEDDVKLVKKIKSKNNFIKLISLGKIKNGLDTYISQKKNLRTLDKNLIQGILYKHRTKTNTERDQSQEIKSPFKRKQSKKEISNLINLKKKSQQLNHSQKNVKLKKIQSTFDKVKKMKNISQLFENNEESKSKDVQENNKQINIRNSQPQKEIQKKIKFYPLKFLKE